MVAEKGILWQLQEGYLLYNSVKMNRALLVLALQLFLLSANALAYSLEKTFASCLQSAMSTYPTVDPLEDYIHSMHLRPTIFGTYLDACMRARGYKETPVDQRCTEFQDGIENEA
jgi:hypothetical protein